MQENAANGVRFTKPVIILSAPRSGSTLLFETLAQAPGVYTIGGESHRVIEREAGLGPGLRGLNSNRLEAAHATDEMVAKVHGGFAGLLRDRHGAPPAPGQAVTFLEKTPKNILRVPFLRKVFPGARFVVLFRDPRAVLSSMMAAWRSGRFVTYEKLPGWRGLPWSLLLVDGWERVNDRPLEEVVAYQWARGMTVLMDSLDRLPASEWTPVRYEDFVAQPQEEARRLCGDIGLDWDVVIKQLPLSRYTLTPPEPTKWRRDEKTIERLLPMLDRVQARVERMLQAHPGRRHAGRDGPESIASDTHTDRTASR